MINVHIQILRAIAVLAVIIFHMKESMYPLGYLGVDIFFVVSGFVITQSISRALQNNSFSLIGFYERRIRRIFPALFIMLIITFVIYLLIATDAEIVNFYYQKPWLASLQVSNWGYAFLEFDYFRPESIQPFLHTWSLGVEEQFYLVYPLLLLSMVYFSFCNRFRNIIIGLLIISSVVVYILINPQFSFYLPFARAYGFLLGGLVYFIKDKVYLGKRNANIIYYGGFLLLLIFLSLPRDHFISYINIYIVVLTAGIIFASCYIQNSFIAGSKVLSGIGNISYSLYLWHFPIIIFYKILHDIISGIKYSLVDYLAMLFITFIVSVVSFKYVEQPFRKNSKAGKIKSFKVMLIAVVAMVGLFVVFKIDYYQIPQEKIMRVGEHNHKKHDFGSKNSALFIGDSHAGEKIEPILDWGKRNQMNLYVAISDDGCITEHCESQIRVKETILKALGNSNEIKSLILTSFNTCRVYMVDYVDFILSFKPDIEIIFIEDQGNFAYLPRGGPFAKTIRKYLNLSEYEIQNKKHKKIREKCLRIVKNLKKRGANIKYIKNDYSKASHRNKILYRDTEHLNQYGVQYFWKETPLFDFKSDYSAK